MTDENVTPEENEGPETDPALEQLKQSNESLLNKNRELLDELKQIKNTVNDLGGLDTVKEVVTKSQEQQRQEMEQENSLDQLKSHYQEEIEKANRKNQELINSMVDSTVEQQLKSAVSKAKGSYSLLEHKLKNQVEGVFEDGKVKLTVKDSNGMPLMVDGKEAGLTDLVEQFKANEEYSRAFDINQGITGSGTPPGPGAKLIEEPKSLDDLTELYKKNPARAMEAMKAKGLV